MKSLHVKLNDTLSALKLDCYCDLKQDSLWCEIDDKKLLLPLAEVLQSMNARVCMITAYEKEAGHELVYHFDIDGVMLNMKLHISDKQVPSITPLFKSANWTERELSEIYGIRIENHPNPQRLFLDEAIKQSVLNEYYSLSSAINGKVSESLWNRVKAEEGVIHG